MIKYCEPIADLIKQLAKLPGIGRKSAQRLAYFIISEDSEYALSLANAILQAKKNIHYCSICHNLTDIDPCPICSDMKRDHSVICVVEDAKDVLAIEKTKQYHGLYHVLGGAISPMQGIGANDLTVKELISRLTDTVKEIILATSLTVEGETTAMYIAHLVSSLPVKATRIAKGIPAGADLQYTDEATLADALTGRKEIL